ncbi:MAG TPA: cadherin-like domain-containing protein, partial [Thermoanaerobaculia bacterium]|nr:cadherin-like domain-containing protein [Thermoanaerobaculia bacterium]
TRGAVVNNGNGTVTYTPNLNTNGADSFTYTVRDAAGLTDTATVSLSISPVNDPPVAVADAATTRENTAVTVTVLPNDSDVEGNTLAVTTVSAPGFGTAVGNPGNTITYTPSANFNGTDTFTYTVSDGQGGTATATVTITVKHALERVAVLGTNSVYLQAGSDVLSGDVMVNQSGTGPFLNGSVELSLAGTVTTPAGYDVAGNRISIASGSTIAGDAFYNQLTGTGSLTGGQTSSITLPIFSPLPAFQTATPGTTNVSVSTNGTRTLAAGSYLDLVVGRKGVVTFTGGTYHFRSVTIDREAKLIFNAASQIRVQQKLSTGILTTIGPATGASFDASSLIFYIGGANGTTGGLTETPRAVEISADNVLKANVYAPNGTIWLKDRTQATGAFLAKDVLIGPDAQVTLDSFYVGQ